MARAPWLSLVTAVSDDPEFYAEHGPITEVVRGYGPWADHDCFLAGPAAAVGPTVRMLHELGVAPARLRYAAYDESPVVSGGEPG